MTKFFFIPAYLPFRRRSLRERLKEHYDDVAWIFRVVLSDVLVAVQQHLASVVVDAVLKAAHAASSATEHQDDPDIAKPTGWKTYEIRTEADGGNWCMFDIEPGKSRELERRLSPILIAKFHAPDYETARHIHHTLNDQDEWVNVMGDKWKWLAPSGRIYYVFPWMGKWSWHLVARNGDVTQASDGHMYCSLAKDDARRSENNGGVSP